MLKNNATEISANWQHRSPPPPPHSLCTTVVTNRFDRNNGLQHLVLYETVVRKNRPKIPALEKLVYCTPMSDIHRAEK
jgi:hypothetical protein